MTEGAAPNARRWRLGAAALASIGALLVGALYWSSSSPSSIDERSVEAIVDSAVGKAVEELQSAPAHSAEVYNTIGPSLVVVRSDGGAAGDASGLGSGVIINDRGAILTSLHVVAGATALRVSFADGTESPASVASSDPAHDIAVLTSERFPDVIVPAVLGSSSGLHVGDEAFAVGHPLGLIGSLTAGVISGFDRSIPLASGATLDGLIQFDAAVNPGNSGGPLLNRNGQVVGIVTALADPSRDGYFVGVGFAVPITTAGGAAGAPPK